MITNGSQRWRGERMMQLPLFDLAAQARPRTAGARRVISIPAAMAEQVALTFEVMKQRRVRAKPAPGHAPDRSGLPRQTPRPLTAQQNALVIEAHGHLTRAANRFRSLTWAAGLDPNDAASHLVIVFAARLQGEHPWDGRASLKNYCYMLARSVLTNLANKRTNRTMVEDAWGQASGVEVEFTAAGRHRV